MANSAAIGAQFCRLSPVMVISTVPSCMPLIRSISRPSESLGNTSTAMRPWVRCSSSSANFSEALCQEFCSLARWPSLSVSSAAEAVRADAAVRQAMASAAKRRRFRVIIVLLRDDTSGYEKFGSAAADFGQVVQQFAQMAAHCGLGQRGVVITQTVHDFGVLADKLLYVEGSCRDVAQPVHLGFE